MSPFNTGRGGGRGGRGGRTGRGGGRGRGRGPPTGQPKAPGGVDKSKHGGKKVPSFKNRVRSLERLINKPGLDSKVLAAKKTELEKLHAQQQQLQQQERERKFAVRYHKIRFFERIKIERRIHALENPTSTAAAAAAGETEGTAGGTAQLTAEERQARLRQLRADLQYVMHFPKGEKYVSLLKDAETPEAQAALEAERSRLRALVIKQLREVAAVTEGDEGLGAADLADLAPLRVSKAPAARPAPTAGDIARRPFTGKVNSIKAGGSTNGHTDDVDSKSDDDQDDGERDSNGGGSSGTDDEQSSSGQDDDDDDDDEDDDSSKPGGTDHTEAARAAGGAAKAAVTAAASKPAKRSDVTAPDANKQAAKTSKQQQQQPSVPAASKAAKPAAAGVKRASNELGKAATAAVNKPLPAAAALLPATAPVTATFRKLDEDEVSDDFFAEADGSGSDEDAGLGTLHAPVYELPEGSEGDEGVDDGRRAGGSGRGRGGARGRSSSGAGLRGAGAHAGGTGRGGGRDGLFRPQFGGIAKDRPAAANARSSVLPPQQQQQPVRTRAEGGRKRSKKSKD